MVYFVLFMMFVFNYKFKESGHNKKTRRDMMMTNMCEEKCSISDWYQFPTYWYYILANLKYSSFINENVIFCLCVMLLQTSITWGKLIDIWRMKMKVDLECVSSGSLQSLLFSCSQLFAYITFETTEKGKKRQLCKIYKSPRWW